MSDIVKHSRAVLLAMAVFVAMTAAASVPAGYYSSLNGKKDAELKTACYQVIRNITKVSSYSALPQYFAVTDVYPNSKKWWDMYSDVTRYAPSFSGLNREHSFPKSWWGGLTDVNAYVDLNHLYPADGPANQAKSNYPLGTVDRSSNVQYDNGVTTVGYAVTGQGGGARYVFEPADEYKGDFARTYFYMVTCYQDYTWTQQYMYMLQQNTYPTLNDWSQQLLLKWSREDPVSQKEIDRNEAVYNFQNNRNPFIDFPQLAEYIWGNKKGEVFKVDENIGGEVTPPEPVGDPTLIVPTQGMSIDFGQVALGKSTTAQVHFQGEYLTSSLTVQIYSGDKDMFSIPSNKIAAYLVNDPDGYWLNITYTPTELGNHTSKLLISDGGMAGSRAVTLVAECLEVPTLSTLKALPATDITAYSYTANWEAPIGEVVDYYLLTRDIYVGGNVQRQEIEADENYQYIEDFDGSEQESYFVQSVRLGYKSEPSNVVFVEHAGITGVETDQPLVVIGLDGTIRFICAAPQTGVRIYDTTGREVAKVDRVANNTDLDICKGVYLVVTDQCRIPRKVVVH